MKVLFVGDIVGSAGREAFAKVSARLREQGKADFVVANAENSAGGKGITPTLAQELFKAGADVLTLGDHAWDQKEVIPYIPGEPRLLRPANYPSGCPGAGWVTLETPETAVTVVNLVGRVFLPPNADCPFRKMNAILGLPPKEIGKVILVDLHAEATSEKIAMGWFLDGKVSAVVGSHTHVQTSDERVLPGGTAYITDLGMTGPKDSVLGRDKDTIIERFLTGMPGKFKMATDDVVVEGVLIDIDARTGKARSIERVRERIV